jgi:hypothetical protein
MPRFSIARIPPERSSRGDAQNIRPHRLQIWLCSAEFRFRDGAVSESEFRATKRKARQAMRRPQTGGEVEVIARYPIIPQRLAQACAPEVRKILARGATTGPTRPTRPTRPTTPNRRRALEGREKGTRGLAGNIAEGIRTLLAPLPGR